MLLAIFFVSLLVISAVSATDNDANDVVNVVDNDTNDVVSIKEISNDIFNTEDDNDVEITQNSDSLLSSDETNKLNAIDGTYPQLQNKINMAEAGSVITLTQNYSFGNDYDYYNGVLIDKPITIDGNGITIDARYANGIFRITADNVIIKNLKFISSESVYTSNMYSYGTGYQQYIDIDWKGNNGELNNVTYVKSDTTSSPCNILVKMEGNNNSISNIKITSMKFSRGITFFSDQDGVADTYGLICLKGNDNAIMNSNVSNNEISQGFYGDQSVTINRYGGVIYIEGDRNTLLNNSINNNYFTTSSGASSTSHGSYRYYSNVYGGIVYWKGNNGNVINSTFNYNKITSNANWYSSADTARAYSIINGGVINWNGNGGIENSIFESNYAESIAYNCNKKNYITVNSDCAQSTGGALYITSPNGFNSISNSNISNNYVVSKYYIVKSNTNVYNGVCSGHAAYLNVSSGKIFNSIFNKNMDPEEKSHASNLVFEGNVDISQCIFSNHNSYDYIIECYGLETNINYNIFVNGSSRFYSSSKKANIDYNWWGSNSNPQTAINGAVCNYWLCANLFVDETLLDEPIIYTKLNLLSDDTVLSDEDYSKLPIRDVKYSLSGYGELSSINSNTVGGISYLNDNPGQYEVVITSKVDNQVTEINKVLNIYKVVGVNIDLDHDSIKYQENITATISMASSECAGLISIYIDGNKIKEAPIDGNNIVIELKELEIGEHNITAVYGGDGYYASTTTTKKINVNKWDAVITTKNYTVTYLDNLTIEVFISNETATGNVTLTVNGQEYTENINNSKAIFKLPIMNAGNYTFTANYNGNQYYNDSNVTGLIIINKIKDFEMGYIIPSEITYGDSLKIDITFVEDVQGDVSFKINDVNYLESVTNKKVTFNLSNLNAGTYYIMPVYSGDINYESKNVTIKFIIDKADSTVNVTVRNNIIYGNNATVIITTNVDGKVRIKIGTFDKTVSVSGKETIIEIPNLDANEEGYSVETIFSDDNNNYKNSNATSFLRVFKADPIFDINITDINYKESTTVYGTFASDINGLANITISNNQGEALKITNILINNGQFNQELNNLNASKYILTFEYNGNENYNKTILTKTFNVFKIDPLVNIDVINAIYGQSAKIIVNSNVEGNITINVGSIKTYDEILIGDILIQDVTDIDAGNYSIKVTYNGNNNYNAKTFNARLKISKASANVVATVDDITYSEMPLINIKSNVDGNIVVKIDNDYIKNINIISNTITPVTFEDNISVGKHNVTIVLKSSNNYNESIYNTEFTISKKQTSITLNVVDSVYGEEVIINVTASADGKITLKVGDITKEKNIFANTLTKINLGILAADFYDVSVKFDAGENYKLSDAKRNIIVTPAEAKITDIRANNNIYGENTTITVKTNVGGILTVKINNIVKTFNIDANKLTSFDLGKYDVNNYNIDLTLDAGANYTQATGNTKVTINPKQTTVSLDANDEVYGNNVIVKVTASENGKVTVQIGNIVKSVNVDVNKVTSVDFGILDVNSYEVIATFDGGKNFNTSSDKDSFEISPKASSVTFVNLVNNYIYSNNVVVNVKSDVAGTVTVKVGDKTQTKQITAGNVVSFDFGILDVNKYDVLISLNAGSNYISSQNTASITISPKSTVVTLNTRDYDADEKVIVNVTASENGKATIKLGNVIKNVDVMANKIASVDFGVLSTGSYDVVATFTAGNNYIDTSDSANIKVLTKIDEKDINITVPEIKPNQENNIVINLPADATGTVTLIIGENVYTFDVKNGIANINVPKLDEGNYKYVINYSGDSKYSSFENTGSIDVAKPDPEIVIPPLDKPSEDGSVAIKLPSDATGTVTLVINGKAYSFPVINGVANVYMPELNAGNYNYSITYSGDGKYSPFTNVGSMNVVLSILKITAPSVTTVYNGGKYVVVTLTDKNDNPISGLAVSITLNGKTYSPITDKNGQVKLSTNGLAPKSYTAKVSFAGNTNYIGASISLKVTVKKATPKLVAKAKTFKKSLKIKKYTVTLKTNQNKVMKNTKVTLKVNGKTYSAKTNTKGQATFKITKLTKKGKFTAVVKFAGNKYYNAKTVKPKITVK